MQIKKMGKTRVAPEETGFAQHVLALAPTKTGFALRDLMLAPSDSYVAQHVFGLATHDK